MRQLDHTLAEITRKSSLHQKAFHDKLGQIKEERRGKVAIYKPMLSHCFTTPPPKKLNEVSFFGVFNSLISSVIFPLARQLFLSNHVSVKKATFIETREQVLVNELYYLVNPSFRCCLRPTEPHYLTTNIY